MDTSDLDWKQRYLDCVKEDIINSLLIGRDNITFEIIIQEMRQGDFKAAICVVKVRPCDNYRRSVYAVVRQDSVLKNTLRINKELSPQDVIDVLQQLENFHVHWKY
jgi:hypothetical protein